MVLEHVHIQVAPERSKAYLRAFAQARPLVLAQPGCRSCRLLPKVEEEGAYLLLIEWESKEAHTEGFRQSEEYLKWSALLHPFYDIFPTVDYYSYHR